jgi:hypothetical protein
VLVVRRDMFRGSLIKHCRTHGLILSQRFGRCYFGPPPIEILHLGSYRTERRDKFSQRCISKKNHRLNSMASKLTNADLVLNALTKVTEGKERHRLIDVGINLADSSYDKVRDPLPPRIFTFPTIKVLYSVLRIEACRTGSKSLKGQSRQA